MINVIIAVETAIAAKLRDNFRLVDPDDRKSGFVRNDLNNAQRRIFRLVYSGHWKGPTYQGTKYTIISLYLPADTVGGRQDPPTADLRLWYLERFKQILPGKEFVLGAWDRSGAQYGTYIEPDTVDTTDPDNPVIIPGAVVGTPVYPVPSIVRNNPDQIFPDRLTFDAAGNATGTVPATGPEEIISISGWNTRRW